MYDYIGRVGQQIVWLHRVGQPINCMTTLSRVGQQIVWLQKVGQPINCTTTLSRVGLGQPYVRQTYVGLGN